ncbi:MULTISPECIES: iron ABC transporter substrate-binding protein [unclassified Pseudofrankia]|uniref:iron ABC transporter substrate-binding protein n=1 Tax=unclassified Pseudofrankia TaxID=2994372 RepID=UPI0008D920B7|nr:MULTISPECIES: iron ABC transporter substrate-binding protein [unclassified Pseudofrankia]MDT3444516.1 iron ABC transporter substrate-binding protein [Pseudofrankia sp. BMG5.37]OHV56394.1 iron ABC transporter substrate-binding protein [Pseudofrankia sp. BMG5.36]
MRKAGRIAAALAAAILATGLSACGSGDGKTLTLYNAQHKDLMQVMIDAFTEQTGIKVEMRSGGDTALANQIIQEGDSSPADVFATENSPAMTLVDRAGGFSHLDAATIGQVPDQYVPSTGNWAGFAARSTVFIYNPSQVTEDQIPTSIMDLAKPEWRGRIGVAAGGADFQAIVSAVLAVEGEPATAEWLAGLDHNAKIYDNNIAAMRAVNTGQVPAAVIYHYYWYQDQAESGEDSKNVKLHFFRNQDAGAFISVSGVGMLAASDQQAEAQQFVSFLTSDAGQRVLVDSGALEYAVSDKVPTNPALTPLADLDAPTIDVGSLNGPKVVELMQKAGLL